MEAYDSLKTSLEDTEVLFEFYKEGESSEEEVSQQYEILQTKLDDLELKNMLSSASFFEAFRF